MTSMISQNEQKENQFSTTVDNFFKTFKIDIKLGSGGTVRLLHFETCDILQKKIGG